MERVAVNLADAFHQQGHDTHLIYLKNRKVELTPKHQELPIHLFDLKKAALSTGVGAIYYLLCKLANAFIPQSFPIWFAYLQGFIFKSKLKTLEKNNGDFDLIIFRGQGTFEQIFPSNDPRFVFVCENIQKPYHYKKLSTWVYNKLFKNRKVSCVSKGALESFQELQKIHSIKVQSLKKISNPNDLEHIKQQGQSVTSPLHNKPYILGLGRLVAQKNFSLLVEAYHKLKASHNIEHDLVIVGAGKDQENIENKVKQLNLQECVHFKGQQNNPYPWFAQADLFVLSSQHEGLGMVLVEALASGTKVVATDCSGGVRDVMQGELEQYLAMETPGDLAQKMSQAIHQQWCGTYAASVDNTLSQFNGATICQTFIKEFNT